MYKLPIVLLLVLAFVAGATAQEPRSAKLARLILKIQPPAMPQTGGATRPSNDLKDERLKGPVRSITEYCQGTIFSETEFGRDGNRTRKIAYDHGELMSVTVYGYIDGERAWLEGYNEPPDPLKDKTLDQRYDFKETYSYDKHARLLERAGYGNDGRRWYRLVYSYIGNELVTRSYDADDQLSGTEREKLDANGHVIERRLEDGLNEGQVWRSVYRLDATGNWTSETTHLESTTDPKQRTEGCTRTRKIVYYR